MVATLLQPDTLPTDLQTVEEFEQWERQHLTEGSYEFVRGRIVRKPAMKQKEIFIVSFLIRLFAQSQSFLRGDDLLPETDSYVDGMRKRVPDLTYFTAEQKQAVRRGERIQTLFAIEILSDSESHEDVLDKIQDYFDGGAQLVWYIVPNRRRIDAYTSPETLRVYKENDLITAAPVVPEMQFNVAEMFA